jgi:hypothetical protein
MDPEPIHARPQMLRAIGQALAGSRVRRHLLAPWAAWCCRTDRGVA